MANTLLLKRRTADATAPTAGQLSVGELAFNANSGTLYGKTQAGTVISLNNKTTGTSMLAGDGSGNFANVAIGSGLSFSSNTLTATGGSGTSQAKVTALALVFH